MSDLELEDVVDFVAEDDDEGIEHECLECKCRKPAERPNSIDDGHWMLILQARQKEKDAERQVADLHEQLKAAKKRLDGASKELGMLLDEFNEPNLFNQQTQQQAQDDEDWARMTLAECGLVGVIPAGKLKLLEEAGIVTFGDLENWRAKGEPIRGIGEETRQAIDDFVAEFWSKRNQPKPAKGAKTLAQLGITEEQLRSAFYPNLLRELSEGKAGVVDEIVMVGDTGYIAVPAEEGDGCDFILMPLYAPTDEVVDEAGNPYAGRLVGDEDGPNHRIGPSGEFVKVLLS